MNRIQQFGACPYKVTYGMNRINDRNCDYWYFSGNCITCYQDYTVRAKVSEIVLAASQCRTTVTETIQSAVGTTLPDANDWGCESASETTKYVKSVATDENGVITVTAQGISQLATSTADVLTLIPMIDATTEIKNTDVGKTVFGWKGNAPLK